MAKEALTAKQKEILQFIKANILERGFPPSVREICKAVDLRSTSSVHSHLEALEAKGYIKKDPTKPRTIEVVNDGFNVNRRELVNIPMLGAVAAGEPIFAQENIQGYFPMPVELLPNAETFMLRVKGDSMINAGILNGDDIIVSKQPDADNGDIVVALIEDSATVKRFFREKECIRLQPENDSMDPILTKDVEILGKVIGLMRLWK